MPQYSLNNRKDGVKHKQTSQSILHYKHQEEKLENRYFLHIFLFLALSLYANNCVNFIFSYEYLTKYKIVYLGEDVISW